MRPMNQPTVTVVAIFQNKRLDTPALIGIVTWLRTAQTRKEGQISGWNKVRFSKASILALESTEPPRMLGIGGTHPEGSTDQGVKLTTHPLLCQG